MKNYWMLVSWQSQKKKKIYLVKLTIGIENQNLKESYNGPLWTDQYQDILTKENIGESFNTLTVSKQK